MQKHLGELGIEFLSEYIHETILPNLESEIVEEDAKQMLKAIYDNEQKKVLTQYVHTCICPSTVYQWMIHLGFKYEPRKKGYYVDGHEKLATVAYHWSFC